MFSIVLLLYININVAWNIKNMKSFISEKYFANFLLVDYK